MTSLSLTGKDGKYSIADEWINAIAFVYTGSILAHGFQVLNSVCPILGVLLCMLSKTE